MPNSLQRTSHKCNCVTVACNSQSLYPQASDIPKDEGSKPNSVILLTELCHTNLTVSLVQAALFVQHLCCKQETNKNVSRQAPVSYDIPRLGASNLRASYYTFEIILILEMGQNAEEKSMATHSKRTKCDKIVFSPGRSLSILARALAPNLTHMWSARFPRIMVDVGHICHTCHEIMGPGWPGSDDSPSQIKKHGGSHGGSGSLGDWIHS